MDYTSKMILNRASIFICLCVQLFVCHANVKIKEKTENSNSKILNSEIQHAIFFQTSKHNQLQTQLSNLTTYNSSDASTTVLPLEEDTTYTNLLLESTTDVSFDYSTSESNLKLPGTTESLNMTDLNIFSSVKGNRSLNMNPKKTVYKYCHCDLLLNACDLNCCCDLDCSRNEKNMFATCLQQFPTSYDSRYCYSHPLIYRNNTKDRILMKVDGLFCIMKENLPAKRITEKYNPLKRNEAEKITAKMYKWPHYYKENIEMKFTNKSYAIGDAVWGIKKNVVSIIDIPSTGLTDYCNQRRPMVFMKNYKTKCIVKINDLEMFNIYDKYVDFFIVSPVLAATNKSNNDVMNNVNDTLNASVSNSTNNNTLLNNSSLTRVNITKEIQNNSNSKFMVKIDGHKLASKKPPKSMKVNNNTAITRDKELWNCSNLSCVQWNISICDSHDCKMYNKSQHAPYCKNEICYNLATKIRYELHCNASSIVAGQLYLYIENISVFVSHLNQEIYVEFYMHNWNISNNVLRLSGNPGYLQGKPVIVSYAVGDHSQHFINSSDHSSVIRYPKNKNGLCLLTNTIHNILTFGLNTRNKCLYKYPQPLSLKNATNACLKFQEEIYGAMGIENNSVYVSPLGNPLNLKDSNWMNLNFTELHRNITGEYNDDKTVLICKNITNSLYYWFLYANDTEARQDIQSERKILYSGVSLKGKEIEHFKTYMLSTLITVETMFFDITRKPKYEFAKAPRLSIHLPQDFFYPFTYGSGIDLKASQVLIWLVILHMFKILFIDLSVCMS